MASRSTWLVASLYVTRFEKCESWAARRIDNAAAELSDAVSGLYPIRPVRERCPGSALESHLY
jgi:hypothetical protein